MYLLSKFMKYYLHVCGVPGKSKLSGTKYDPPSMRFVAIKNKLTDFIYVALARVTAPFV